MDWEGPFAVVIIGVLILFGISLLGLMGIGLTEVWSWFF